MSKTNKVTRVEVIDHNGRSYVNMNCEVDEIQFQDDDKTMKIFLKNGKNKK